MTATTGILYGTRKRGQMLANGTASGGADVGECPYHGAHSRPRVCREANEQTPRERDQRAITQDRSLKRSLPPIRRHFGQRDSGAAATESAVQSEHARP